MPTECSRDLFGYEVVEGRQVVAAFDGGEVTSDAGALLLGATDRAIGLVTRFAACFDDGRDQAQIEHTVEAMVAQRVFGIALGDEDLVDHDHRSGPQPRSIATTGGGDAGRQAHREAPGLRAARRQEHAQPARACACGAGPLPQDRPRRGDRGLVRRPAPRAAQDAATRDHPRSRRHRRSLARPPGGPAQRSTNGASLHGYYDCSCYPPLYVFCGRHLLAAKLRRSNIDASAGALEEVARIVGQIRARWPRVKILLRADSGFARDQLMAWCEANGVDYVFGLARNQRLVDAIADELAAAEAESRAVGGSVRRFADFAWRTLDSWSRERRVVAKAEHLPRGSNPRFVVTSLPATALDARTLDEDVYCARGEVENRISEAQKPCAEPAARPVRRPHLGRDPARQPSIGAPTPIDRLWFASLAYMLLEALRRTGPRPTRFAVATCATIRLKLLKTGAHRAGAPTPPDRKSARRIKLAMASACPYQAEYHLAYLYLRRAAAS